MSGAVIVSLTLKYVEEALGLPEDTRLTGVVFDQMRRTLEFRIDGPGLPDCGEGASPIAVGSPTGAGSLAELLLSAGSSDPAGAVEGGE